MRRLLTIAAVSIALLGVALPAAAQGRGNGGAGSAKASKKGGGPAFCASGAGHPVYGRGWCVRKGFGLGGSDWRRVDYGRFEMKGRHHSGERVDRGGLAVVLGAGVFARFEAHRAELGISAELSGRWLVPDDGPAVLQLYAGDVAMGEIVDDNRDGRVDSVMLAFSLGR